MAGQSPDDDLEVAGRTIPSSELEWRFTTSGGPGGQHANRSNTRAELVYDLENSDVFPPELRARMIAKLGDPLVVVSAADSRSQFRNRMLARSRLRELLVEAQKQPKPRKPTKPTRASRRRRLEEKRAHSEKKRLRRRID